MENLKNYKVTYSKVFTENIDLYKKSGQKILTKKIATFIIELTNNPTTGTGQTEQLKHYQERAVYSKRINKQHRLVYEIFEDKKEVHILSAYGHYD